MAQLEHIEAIEKRLWKAADTLRSNSELASNEYFMPVMGLIFLRHAYNRFLKVKNEIEADSFDDVPEFMLKLEYSTKGAIYLKKEAQFDYLVSLPDSSNRGDVIIKAMELIEEEVGYLKDLLPKQEYRSIPNDVLGQLLRALNPDELKKATGDIFGRIYEYFLTEFAGQGAHDGGEFFTPVSLVQMIVNVIEPDHGKIFDPACGSGGMFVQSAHFMERHAKNPNELTFYGHEKNKVTTRLAKMNLAVHGLEGSIIGGEEAITYYKDPHDCLWSQVDFVMANPPFNVDEVDKSKVENDFRLPFGTPSANKAGRISNANYLWIQYFYSYLNDKGRAGFVMSSQASSAGREEARIREQLVKTGHVDIMIDIRGNFFYTRTVPCQLWFFDKAKPEELRSKVLMIDARNVYRKVTRKIMDFSPEQLQNLSAIVWLYRGQTERFIELVQGYVDKVLNEGFACRLLEIEHAEPVPDFIAAIAELKTAVDPFLLHLDKELGETAAHGELYSECLNAWDQVESAWLVFQQNLEDAQIHWTQGEYETAQDLWQFIEGDKIIAGLAEQSRDLLRDIDLAYKLAARLIEYCEKEQNAKDHPLWDSALINGSRKTSLRKIADNARKVAVEQLKQVRYFYKQAHWLLSRFPDGELADVAGLVKLVDVSEITAADWSLTPGRYVGVAPEEVDEEFDFEEALRGIHVELQGLNEEAVELAAAIARNFEELGI